MYHSDEEKKKKDIWWNNPFIRYVTKLTYSQFNHAYAAGLMNKAPPLLTRPKIRRLPWHDDTNICLTCKWVFNNIQITNGTILSPSLHWFHLSVSPHPQSMAKDYQQYLLNISPSLCICFWITLCPKIVPHVIHSSKVRSWTIGEF